MDTNLLAILRELLAHQPGLPPPPPPSGNGVIITTMIIGAAANMLGLILTYLKAASTDKKADVSTETLKEIHVAVNSKETATAKKIEDLTSAVLTLTEKKATADERIRGQESKLNDASIAADVKKQVAEK